MQVFNLILDLKLLKSELYQFLIKQLRNNIKQKEKILNVISLSK